MNRKYIEKQPPLHGMETALLLGQEIETLIHTRNKNDQPP
jgi:hypothetical protein